MDFSPIIISLKTAFTAIIFTFLLGLWTAVQVSKLKSLRLKAVVDTILTLPLVLPPTVAGFFLLYLFGLRYPLGQFFMHFLGVKIAFSWGATVIAAVVISFPLMYRSAKAALDQVNPDFAAAGRTLGLTEYRIFWHITLPQAKAGIISGSILAFTRALGEFGATIMIAGNIPEQTRTLPLAIYSAVASGNMNQAGHYVFIMLLIAFLIVFSMNIFIKKGEAT